jgi:hypothetical protein
LHLFINNLIWNQCNLILNTRLLSHHPCFQNSFIHYTSHAIYSTIFCFLSNFHLTKTQTTPKKI